MTAGAPDGDGLRASPWEELRWCPRFRRSRRTPIPWRKPTRDEESWASRHPDLGRFADSLFAVAAFAGRRWFVGERLWHGWPDMPRFVLFVLEDETVWAAWDFGRWPPAWPMPGTDADATLDTGAAT